MLTTPLPEEQRATQVLRAIGQRVTRPRVEVLACVLAAGDDHLSADALFDKLQERSSTVHLATVYRTLDGLTQAGVLRHVHLDRGISVYHAADRIRRPAAVDGHGDHLHAQCSVCGRVVDLPASVLDEAVARVRQAGGFVLDPAHVALSGRCADCADRRHR